MKSEILRYLRKVIDYSEVQETIDEMYITREPLYVVNEGLFEDIHDALEEFGDDNDLPKGWWKLMFDIEDLMFEL